LSSTARLVPVVLLLAGCSVAPGHFGEAYGHALCKLQQECAEGSFNATYPSLRACYDAQDLAWAASENALAGCLYDRKQAARCVDAIDKARRSCDPNAAAAADATCGAVYLCGGGIDTAGL
jgi:hypothetical protein